MVFIPHAPMVAFDAAATAKCGAPMMDKFYCDVGSRLVSSKTLSSTELPSSSSGPGAVQGMAGTIRARCHALGAKIHWHKADITSLPAGADYGTFVMYNTDLFAQILSAFLVSTPGQGSGAYCKDTQAGTILDYSGVCDTVSAASWTDFSNNLDAGDLTSASALMDGTSKWSRNLKRTCLYYSTGSAKTVPPSEPQRVILNRRLQQFGDMQSELLATATRRCMPGLASISEPAARAASDLLMAFHGQSTIKTLATFRAVASELMLQTPGDVSQWSQAEVQQGLKIVMTVLTSTFGPLSGVGVPDRAAAIISEWAVVDPFFDDWAQRCATDNGSA